MKTTDAPKWYVRSGHVLGNTMKMIKISALLLLWMPIILVAQKDNQQKLAQTGMKFLAASPDPRAAGLGDAMTALEGGAEMMFYNPAGMANMDGKFSVSFGQMAWIADIKYNLAGAAFKAGNMGTFGVNVMSVDYGEIQATVRADNERGYVDLPNSIHPVAMAVGVSYARALSDRFAIGGSVKRVMQDLGSAATTYDKSISDYVYESYKQTVMAYDFGVLYKTGFKSLQFAFNARNFAKEIKYEEETFQLPLTMRMGLSMDLMDFSSIGKDHNLLLSVDAEHPRDFAEVIKLGTEYSFRNLLSLRAGYAFPSDQQGLTFGGGIQVKRGERKVQADYSYTQFGVFNAVQRIGIKIGL